MHDHARPVGGGGATAGQRIAGRYMIFEDISWIAEEKQVSNTEA
jgi:hypothetical protein